MTLQFLDGFEIQDWLLKGWALSSGGGSAALATTTNTPFALGRGIRVTGSNAGSGTSFATQRLASAVTHLFCGHAAAISGSSDIPSIRLLGDSGTVVHLTIATSATGQITIYRGTTAGTVLATSALGAWNPDTTWAYVEVEAVISDTVGVCNVKVNGVTVVTFSGDTKNAGTNSSIDRIDIGFSGKTTTTYDIDDFYVCDASGSTNNTFLGPWARVQTCKPSGAGSSTQFTPVSGSNFSNVNDSPDNTATYNSDTVSGHRDTFAMDDLLAGTGTILGVQQVMHARQLDGGTATIKQAQKSGATVSYGSTKTLGASNTLYSDIFETNPATGIAYTASEINALEAGYEVV